MPRTPGEDPLAVLPEGIDLERYASALEAKASKAGCPPAPDITPLVTVRVSMEPDAAGFFQTCMTLCRAIDGRHLLDWECANRFLDAFFAVYPEEDQLKYALNHKVFARDGYRCQCPGCRSRSRLHMHHLEFRSQGGSDDPANLTTVCSCHHQQLIHKGTAEVRGTAPGKLTWRLGARFQRAPLMTIGPGERILPNQEPRNRRQEFEEILAGLASLMEQEKAL